VLAVVGVLLVPDAKSLKVGGLAFERLTKKVDQQTQEISQLRATMSTTVNVGADFIDHLRTAIRQQKDTLGDLRARLPTNPSTISKLKIMDDVAQQLDEAQFPELLSAALAGQDLIREARATAEEAVVKSVTVSDADVASAQEAEEVLSRIPPPGIPQHADDGPD
jgi:hypothetical protein